MLEPSPQLVELIPTSFLPQLPRTKNTLSPLSSEVLLANIALLRELYIPLIHGGFRITDVNKSPDDVVEDHVRARARRFSASLVDTMDGLGLGLDVDTNTYSSSEHISLDQTVPEEGDGEDEDEDLLEPSAHLDPFEREWSEKWLNGIVRRAQTWIEEHDDLEGEDEDGWTCKNIEVLLRDATAVLAMMAGTSGESSLRFYNLTSSRWKFDETPAIPSPFIIGLWSESDSTSHRPLTIPFDYHILIIPFHITHITYYPISTTPLARNVSQWPAKKTEGRGTDIATRCTNDGSP